MQYRENIHNEFATGENAAGNDGASDKLYDLSMLYEMDDNEYVAQILTIFLRDTPKELCEMVAAASARKADAVHSSAHRLKSSTGIISAYKMNMLLEQIEAASRGGKCTAELFEAIEKAGAEYNKIQAPLRAELKSLG